MTSGWTVSPGAQRRHANVLAQAMHRRVDIGGADAAGGWTVADADDQAAAASKRPVLRLAHAPVAALALTPGGGARIDYSASEAASARALIAALTAPAGVPIAAAPESIAITALAARIAASDIAVLIGGPTGTGKEVLSRYIHAASPRAARPFIAVNCAALPEAMLEALLFGHRKGAFTGASEAAEGFFRAADGGTLLLDEIAELPLALQAKLLRVLQEGEVVPLGATKPIAIDVRIIAAANRDLLGEVEAGRFRADLFYRLNVFPLTTRALRERAEDVPVLAAALLLRHANGARTQGGIVPWLSAAALDRLAGHSWPGNVRELDNVIQRALLLSGGAAIAAEHIQFDRPVTLAAVTLAAVTLAAVTPDIGPAAARGGEALGAAVRGAEADAIMAMLRQCGGHRGQTARRLGISERTLRYRLARYRDAAGNDLAADAMPLSAAL